jgi:hypothetical protein
MNVKNRLLAYIVIMSLFVMTSSCATTTLNNVWRDGSYGEKLNKVFVIGVIKNPGVKRFFEDEFAAQLKARGTDAVAGYTVLQSDAEIDKENLAAALKETGADSVLITRLVDKKTVETYVPPTTYASAPRYVPPTHYYGCWHHYYARSYDAMYTPGYTVKDEVLVVETNLYEASSEKLVWSAISETFREGSSNTLIKSFIKVMIENLSKENLL